MNHAAVRPVLLDYFCSDIVDVEKWKPVDDRIDYSIELSIGTGPEEPIQWCTSGRPTPSG